MTTMKQNYKKDLISCFWRYQDKCFPEWKYFDRSGPSNDRSPVFIRKYEHYNVILNNSDSLEKQQVLQEIPRNQRHRWFRSMTSSQALAQSVFGNLKIYDRLSDLTELKDDYGLPVFENVSLDKKSFEMEHAVEHLNEQAPRLTSLDAYFSGEYQVAIECKLSEQKIGACSRPALKEYDEGYCKNGQYIGQANRKERCSLTEAGISYWKYIPELFTWRNDIDHPSCPLRFNYQLVRNILSVCVSKSGKITSDKGHVVLVYDCRNPSFQTDGDGYKNFKETRNALKNPTLLRSCSWQETINLLRRKNSLKWLTDELELKYGI